MGMSSRIGADKITPACWAEDVVAVMDAVGSEQATIFASGFTAMSALFLAGDRPERVSKLVIVNGAARALWAPDYEVGSRANVASPFTTVAIEPDAVERGFDVLAYLAPSVADDVAFRTWWDAAGNRAASPSMARRSNKALAEGDVRDKLPQITAPTLVLHRRDTAFVPVGHGRYLAEHIAGARYVELPGADALYWVGDSAPIIDEIEEFITGIRGGAEFERVLTTIVFTDIVGSTQRAAALGDDRWHALLDNHDTLVRRELERFRGIEVNTVGDGFVAMFPSPSAAIQCASAIVDAVRRSASKSGWVSTPERSRCAATTSQAWQCTSGRGCRDWRARARCWCPRRCARSSRGHGNPSTIAASTISRVCRAAGGCTHWSANSVV